MHPASGTHGPCSSTPKSKCAQLGTCRTPCAASCPRLQRKPTPGLTPTAIAPMPCTRSLAPCHHGWTLPAHHGRPLFGLAVPFDIWSDVEMRTRVRARVLCHVCVERPSWQTKCVCMCAFNTNVRRMSVHECSTHVRPRMFDACPFTNVRRECPPDANFRTHFNLYD